MAPFTESVLPKDQASSIPKPYTHISQTRQLATQHLSNSPTEVELSLVPSVRDLFDHNVVFVKKTQLLPQLFRLAVVQNLFKYIQWQ